MAVNCSWADAQVQSDASICSSLPPEILHIILNKTGREYLDALALASLRRSCTDRLFVLYEPLIVEITARWLSRTALGDLATDIDIFSGLARVLPMAPYLKPRLSALLGSSHGLKALRRTRELNLVTLADQHLLSVLIAGLRLLTYDVESFAFVISPLQLSSLLAHTNRAIRCLATQCISLQMKMSDALYENMLANHVPDGSTTEAWEGRSIDYRWLKLFEEDRWKRLEQDLRRIRFTRPNVPYQMEKSLTRDMLSSQTAKLANILIPRSSDEPSPSTVFVPTLTTTQNLNHLAQAFLESNPILLTGKAGSGKTSLINEAARELNKLSSMITLHLNDQTDAKSLIGLYTTSATGSFVWQPGILTRAMEEGKWVVIEDIDRAPSEVIGVLLPIIDKGVLLLPNRREEVRAADGFRILATMRRSDESLASRELLPRSLLGSTRWKQIQVQELKEDETAIVLSEKFPLIHSHIGMILRVINRVKREYHQNPVLKNLRTEATGLRAVLKWCHRINSRLKAFGRANIHKGIPESIQEATFMDALDCFAGHLPTQATRFVLAECVAEEMHIAPRRRDYCVQDRTPSFHETASEVKLGRAVFPRVENRKQTTSKAVANQPFASTRHARKVMESMLAALVLSEPVLLVGETGIGKTAFVQRLARAVNQKLTVINLSQQSESSDLLGGFKPITTRSLALPLADTFNDLFNDTFSAERNQKFQSSVTRCVAKQNWRRLLLLWQEATKKAQQKVKLESGQPIPNPVDEQPMKRRRLAFSRGQALRQRWTDFSTKMEAFGAQLSRGDKNFAFAFVEGKIVDAVRNGEWILFDEMNLASPDTLDSIASLLRSGDDGLPFLLLPEAGNLECVLGHPSLRLFAAMNPATDTGKKDLAPVLRARFTEIFVPSPDDDLQDLISLVKTYFGSLIDVDDRAASDLARLYLQIKKLNDENCLTDGAGDRPHFSIRSLVRCLMYVVQNTPAYGLRRAMYEGAAMSFLTVLSKDSSRTILPLVDKYILSSVKNARSLLSQMRKTPPDGQFVIFKHHWLQQGPLAPQQRPQYIITAFVEKNLLNLARATSMKRFPVLLQGPTSSGKTSMVEHLARVSGHHFIRINNHEHTDLQEYLGFYASDDNGKLQYREGILVQALREGHWIVLDELNLAPTDVLEALNRLLDDNRELLVPESQEIIKPHPNFMLFATQNPAGAYGGRKRLSRAFRNRFLEIHFDDIPEDELEIILTERTAIAPSFCTGIVSVYKRLALLRQSTRLFEQRNSFITLRDLFRWALRRADDRQQLANNGFMLLAERVRDPVERRAVKSTIEDVLKVKINEISLYSTYPVPTTSELSDGIVWTPAMKRLYALVSEAITHNEPVLLIGETGCGKTQICQTMALAAGRRLQIYNAHANTETGDLIGVQRPTRQKTKTEGQLREDIEQLLNNIAEKVDHAGLPLDELIDNFEQADYSSTDSALVEKIRRQIAHRVSLFEWMDGSLVRAMKDGDHFLLDEISLAEDSVLERLNSLLEPERTLFLAEKGPTDSSIVAAPGFQFLATMNPGGDYGKRELSAALRNRFTEIWVPPLTDDQDILPILQSKLPSSVRGAAQVMLEFAKWFKAFFENAMTTSISLRNLLSWSDFVRATAHLTACESIVHGAAMVYIDSLGANPSGIMSVDVQVVDAAKEQCLTKLGELLQHDTSSIYHRCLSLDIGATVQIGCFHIDADPASAIPHDLVFDAPTTLQNGMRVIRALQLSKAILLEGNPGAGKTALITALARIAGKSLVRINLSDQTDLMDLFGADVPTEGGVAGSFSWRDGPLLQAMQSGAWVLLDEMNLASQSILEGLNSCLDHRQEVYISELDRTFQRHPNFMLFAAQNPHHKGGGRKGLPVSFVNRFTVVYTKDFQTEDLSIICRRQFPTVTPSDLANVLTSFFEVQKRLSGHRAFQNVGGQWDINLRDITRWLQLSARNCSYRSPLQYLDVVIGRRFRTAEQRAIINEVLDLQPNQFPQQALYHNLTLDSYQVGSALLKRNSAIVDSSYPESVSAPPDLSSMEGLMLGVSQAWPSILVGPAGCGKSVLIQNLAARIGTKLIGLPMNADTDVIDLIGGFEQFDAQHYLSALRQEFCQILKDHIARSCLESPTARSWDLAMDLYERLVISGEDLESIRPVLAALSEDSTIFATYLTRVDVCLAEDHSSQMKFQWVDGALVEAVENGYWVVLENANLCNASVLDRLNSLLEPDGSLIISEQHNLDGHPRLIRPHKDFRIFLTMDPRHGELSPAMRNRSLEIHMESKGLDIPQPQALTYPTASAISRIRLLLHTDLSGTSSELRMHITRIGLDHLSLHEHMSSHRWQASLSSLLTQEDTEQITYYQHLPPDLITQIHQFYILLSSKGTLSKNQVLHQSIRPILNRHILIDEHMALALTLAWFTESLVSLAAIQKRLENAAGRVRNLKMSEMTILESSFHAEIASTNRMRKPQRIAASLELLGHAIHVSLHKSICIQSLSSPRSGHDPRPLAHRAKGEARPLILSAALAYHRALLKSVLDFLSDFMHLTSHTQLQPGVFQVYLQIGQKIAVEMQSEVSDLSEGLSNALALLEESSPLRFGRSLLRMWDLWRPITASTSSHLEQLGALELVADRFDELVLRVPNWAVFYADVRVKLLLAWEDALRAGTETTMLVRNLESIVGEMQSRLPLSDFVPSRFFSTAFENLCQIRDLHDDRAAPSFLATGYRETILIIKAGRKTRLHEQNPTNSLVPGLLSKVARFGGSENSGAATRAWRRTTIIDLMLKVSACQDQPLASLDSLTEDTTFIIGALSSLSLSITSSNALRLKSEVAFLLQQILRAHEDLFEPGFEFSKALSELNKTSGPTFGEKTDGNHYFRAITSSYLKPAAMDLAQDGLNEEARLTQAGSALLRVCIALLYLFVPDQPLDPALSLAVQRERYDRRLWELQTKLQALRIFEKSFSDGAKTMEMEMVTNDISALGERPLPPSVARPQETDLPLLSAEFSNVISVITNAPERFLIRDVVHAPTEEHRFYARRREAILFQQNIARTVQRLSNSYRSYADLTVPVIRTLQCLSLAVDLVMLRDRPVSNVGGLIEHISMHTPFLGAKPVAFAVLDFPHNLFENCSMAVRLPWLDHLALRYAASCGYRIDNRADEKLMTIMDQFYQEWKLRLTKDQQLEARQSRYYSYRGEDENDDAAVQAQMQELFPNFSDDSNFATDGTSASGYDPRTVALKLAKLLEVVNSSDRQQDLEELVFTGLELLRGVAKDDKLDYSPVPSESMLPGALLLSHGRWERLQGTGAPATINIYTDADPVEARRICDVTTSLRLRIEEIIVTWPEHALLHDICACCREVLQFKISDPLAKILAKAERLHQLTSEWQAVASKEFSVISLLDQLTQLIISWRKLELKSWNGLLDLEEQKCQEDARSWFFVAYEVVVAIPEKIVSAGEDVARHVDDLVTTLESFLKHTASGQFAERLKLIEELCCFVSRFSKHKPDLRRLASSITNLLQHHKRYKAAVEKSLQDGRTKLKLEVEEQILSARWKDTNVTALRDSANRSHHKLFKIVRKYRALLLQPIREPAAQLASAESFCTTLHLGEAGTWSIPSAAVRALDVCQQELLGWQSRPTRLRDAVRAAASMRQLYLSKRATFNPHEEVNSMTGELSESIKELKSLTPGRQTEDNKDLVQHLKTRKRRLLADVLKTLRHMGVRRNLSVDELSKQRSTAHILSTTPCLVGSEEFTELNLANNEFHGFLDYMPQIQATLQEHSDELTGSEVNRCVGLAEGLLLLLRNQRASLSPVLASLNRFHTLFQMVAELQRDQSDSIITATHVLSSDLRALMQQLHWLPNVLDLGRKVLEIQAKHTKLDLSPIVNLMRSRSNTLREVYLKLQEASHLPPGLSTKFIVTTSQNAHELITGLRRNLLDFMERQPHTAYLLKQVVWWTERQPDDANRYINGTNSQPIANLDKNIRKAIDKVFVALQEMVEAGTSALPSTKDTAWLRRSDAATVSLMKALRIEKITIALETALHQIHRVDNANIPIATSLFIVVTPIIEQYYYICCQVFKGYIALHHETGRYSNVLARAFLAISSEGFCSPLDESAGEKEQSRQIEQGTGLGEGEGAEDISKDVGEDEDLSELAQDRNLESQQNEMSDAEDAVDMADGDLEGGVDNFGHDREHQEDGDGADEVEESGDLEEEAGSVDDLDPSAVDEKLWNELQNENERGLDSNNDSGQASDEQAAANENQQSKKAGSVEDLCKKGAEENESSIGEEDEALGRQEQDQLDPHVQEEQTLGLPEDMQLDGDKNTEDDTMSDDGLDEFSDIEHAEVPDIPLERPEELGEDGGEEERRIDADTDSILREDSDSEEETKAEAAEDPLDGENESDADIDDDRENRITRQDEHAMNAEDATGEDTGLGGQANEEAQAQEHTSPADQAHQAPTREDQDLIEDYVAGGANSSGKNEESGPRSQRSDVLSDRQAEAFKKVGNVLDQWYQRREILKPSEKLEKFAASADVEMTDADLEHVEDDADQGDAQALDAATKDQARPLDQSKALIDDEVNPDGDHQMPDADEDRNDVQEHLQNTSLTDLDQQVEADRERLFDDPVGKELQTSKMQTKETSSSQALDKPEEVQDVDEQFSAFQLTSSSTMPLMSFEEASRLWTNYSSSIHSLSLLLTEQLRLILAPTLATKLRGDFRTGKRLNIKRIIPYIASGYKRDKIWKRRSVPSKRNYQIMIAVDNSKSMMEGDAGALALESLGLLCKSLSMLEVGEICVVGFGEEEHVRVAQPFAQKFTSDSGPRIFRHFSFQQTATNVRKLIAESISLFREARAKSTRANADLWQLELIISDGICEDHDTIRRLVRQAAEERIMIVFVIVDSANASGSSILDLQRASYEPDGADGEPKLTVKRYLDGFPFPYYLIVRDVRDLPGVLATALKGWFAEVVDVQG
jgi:midasin